MTLAALVTIWAAHLAAAMSAGPAVLLAARTGMTESRATACALALGIGLGAAIWAAAALLGLAVLSEIAPPLLAAIKVIGAICLVRLAVRMWRHAAEPLVAATPANPRSPVSAIRLGMATQLANPKPAVFFGAIFAGLVPPETGLGWRVALIGMVTVNDGGWCTIVARLFGLSRIRTAYARLKTGIERSFGALLGALALRIALP